VRIRRVGTAAAVFAGLLLAGPTAVASAQSITPGGGPVRVTVATAHEDMTVTFSGSAGRRVSLSVSAVTIGSSACCSMRVSIRKPDGTSLVSPIFVGTAGGFLDTATLPVTGTYSIFVDPQGSATGSLTLTLHEVPPDAAATITRGGPAATVTTTTPGQNARLTFAGTAGELVSLSVAPSCCTNRVSILNPNGSTLTAPGYIGSAGGFVDRTSLPTTGTYTILVDPQAAATGSFTFTLHAVPPDVTGSIVPGGPPASVTTTTPGQNARLTFAGTAGQRVSLALATTCCATRVSVLRPGGSTLVSPVFLGVSGGFVDAATLPVTGTYAIFIDPQSAATGPITATLHDVPPDVTGSVATDGVDLGVTTATPGQNARVTFAGTAGRRIAVEVGPTCCAARISILRPDGTALLAPVFIGTLGGFVDPITLPATGTYTIAVDPQGAATGSITLALHDVPADLTSSIGTDGVPVSVTTTVAGQNARLTFAGAIGQRVSLAVTTGCCATRVSILNPNGSTLVPATSLSSGGGFVDTKTLLATGTYTIVVDIVGAAAGPITFTLYDVPADVTASAALNGAAVTVVTNTPGQNARVTFSATAGDGISIRVGPFNCCAIRLTVLRPDGATVLGPVAFNPDGGTVNTRLPVTGLYAIVVDPQGAATGDVTLRLTLDNTPPAVPVLTLAESSPDSHVAGTTLYYRSAGTGGSFTVNATTADGPSGLEKMRFPGLAGGFTPTTFADDFVTPYTRGYSWTAGATYANPSNAVSAYDKVGNTTSATFAVTPDPDPPTTTDNTGSLGPAWKNTTQTVVLSAVDALSGVAVTYSTTDGSAPTTASPQGTTVTLAAEGIHTVRYFSVDNVGNVETARTSGTPIRIDKTRPSSASLDPLPSVIRNGQVLTGSGADALSGVASISYYYCPGASCTPSVLAGSSSTTSNYPFTWGVQPADGAYQVLARVVDAAGNTLDSAKRTVTIDNTAPNTTITSGPSTPTNQTGASFSFSASEAGSTFQCRLDGGAWLACTSPAAFTSLTPGAHTFEVRATDPVGNTDPTPAGRSWTVDVTAPETTITDAPTGPSGPSVSFSFGSTEAGATFQCRLDGAAWTSCTSPTILTALTDGPHTFEVRATDPAGNTDATPATHAWSVDRSAPETTITDAPADPSGLPVASFSFVSSEPGSTFQCRLDGALWTGCTSPATYAALVDGTHTFEVRATDPVGNTDATPASRTWRVDTAAPNTTITSGPPDPTNETSASFSFAAGEAGSTFQCRLDGGVWVACPSPTTYTALAQGEHTFEARATDPAGNTDPTAATWTWRIDLDPPQTTITGGPADPTSATTAAFAFAADETGASFQCSLDGAAFASCASPQSYAGLSDGAHSFEVHATDAAGNADLTPAGFTWTVDRSAPDTAIDSGPADPTNATTASFAFTSTQAGSSFACSLDGAAFSPCASPESYGGLGDGNHTFQVRAADGAGNTDPTPATYTWKIDLTPPETTITTGPADPTNATGAVFTFGSDEASATFECSLDGSLYEACPSPKAYSGLQEGSHTFAVRARDAAGSADTSPSSHQWTVDTTAPVAPVLTSPDDGSVTGSDSVTVGGTAEQGSVVEVYDGDVSKGVTTTDAGGAWWKSITSVADGSHTYTAKATDAAGNTSAASNARTVTVDTAAPETVMGTSPVGSTAATSALLTFSADEPGSRFECSLDAAGFGPCASPVTYNDLTEGPHTFEVRATDPSGNIDPTPAGRTWTVDTTAPAAPVLTSPDDGSLTASSTVTVAGTAEPGSVVEVYDGAVSKGVTTADGGGVWSKTLTAADGVHTYTARATDAAGNDSAVSSARTIAVDTTAPQTSIDSRPADPTAETNADFVFSADETGSTFECSLDGGAFSACSPPQSYTGLTPGSHAFEVRAVDPAGNVDQTPAAYNWTVA
jgi:large repetitive protein